MGHMVVVHLNLGGEVQNHETRHKKKTGRMDGENFTQRGQVILKGGAVDQHIKELLGKVDHARLPGKPPEH